VATPSSALECKGKEWNANLGKKQAKKVIATQSH
jgi:hypothetical protein